MNPKNGKLSTAGRRAWRRSSAVTKSDPGTYAVNGSITVGPFTGKTLRLTLRTDLTHAARLGPVSGARDPSIGSPARPARRRW